MVSLAAVVWSYWIGVAVAIPTILIILGVAVGYVVKVVRPQYPPHHEP